jgi:hypothetical protein
MNYEHSMLGEPVMGLPFKKHGRVPKQMTITEDVAGNRPELVNYLTSHPGGAKFKTANEVLVHFMCDAKRLWAQRGVKVAFRRPKRRGKVRLVKVGPKGGETNLGIGANEVEALMDAEARRGVKELDK